MTSVLVIDDDDSNRLTLSALLEGEGFQVREAASFADACRVLSGEPAFALVLTDQNLGDGLGSQLLPLIRSRLPHAKIVLLSGSAREALSAAAWDGCFAKGEAFSELLQLVHGLCDFRSSPIDVNA
jgi:two-component system, response regulator RegA